jgi:hypothetical protein
MDLAASSEGMLMERNWAAAGTADSAEIATPQASQYLRFDAIIPLRLFYWLPAPEASVGPGRIGGDHPLRFKSFLYHPMLSV